MKRGTEAGNSEASKGSSPVTNTPETTTSTSEGLEESEMEPIEHDIDERKCHR